MSDREQPGQGAPTVDPMDETATVERPPGAPPPVEDLVAAGNPLVGVPSLAPGRTLAGRYTVLGLLGQGGMGVVLAAYDARLDRRVALKLLHPKAGPGSAALKARMEREAQAMARLSHPHVVSVYDTGTLEDGSILIAMEMVEGQTLRRWCEQQPRTWREILAAHVAAGHGLAAAHAAGLIHRDFKPDNVLVGRDGRVRVTDFGLARVDSAPPSEPLPGTSEPVSPGDWARALTLPGTLLGTPRYMAPEMVQRRPADARSDVFSFCVALYEALYGQHPFPGLSLAELHRAQLEGRVSPPPSQTEVPAWVARAVLHGLKTEPSQRPASMGELLAALQDDPEVRHRARRNRVLMATVMVGLAGLAVWGWLLARAQGAGCVNLERKLAGAWDTGVKEKMRQSFLGTGLPYAQDSFTRVSTLLDGYAGAWVKARTEACEAGQQQAQQARDLAVLQVYCLERRHSQLRTLTGLFSQGLDRESLPKAMMAAQSLPSLEYCADAKALMAAVPLPEDPAMRAQVESLQDQVARLDALHLAGKYREGLSLGDELLRQVERVDYVPLRAHAMYQVASLRVAAGDYDNAEALLRQTIPLAAQSKELVLEASAWSLLVRMMGTRQARYQEAMGLRLTVEAAVERAADARVRGAWLNNLGMVLYSMGKYEEARAQHERALSILEQALGPDHSDAISALHNLVRVFDTLGDYEKAKTLNERALSLREKTQGPDHPGVATALSVLGSVLWRMGSYEDAKARFERMRTIREKALGPEHPDTSIALGKLAMVLHDLGQYEEAKALAERALSIREKAQGQYPEMTGYLNALGLVLHGMGQYEKAQAQHERARTLCERSLGADHPDLAEALMRLGRAQVHLGKFEEAHLHLEHAGSIMEKAFGPEHPELAEVHLGTGELLLARGKPAEAVPHLERALVLAPGRLRAEAQLTLARALWLAGKETQRPRALSLAMSARKHYQDIAHGSKLAEVSRWLAAHPQP